MTASKDNNWIKDLIERCKNDPNSVERCLGLHYPCVRVSEEIPDLSSAYRLFYKCREDYYIRYISDFRLRNPVMYALGYRWWFFYSIPKEIRVYLFRLLKHHPKSAVAHLPYWADFARYHPVLFFLWLILITVFQVVVKAVSAPIEIWRKFVYPKSPSLKRVENIPIDHEFIEEACQVP